MKKTDLRRRAEASLSKQSPKTTTGSRVDAPRLLHELQVHQIELEMQNAELLESRSQTEALLEKYVDLYDFAPVGYVSLDEKGRIQEVNLTGATLLGVERSRLLARSLPRFAVAASRSIIQDLLARAFTGNSHLNGEAILRKEDGTTFWAGLHVSRPLSVDPPNNVCRMAITDISLQKQAEEDRRQAAILAHSNDELQSEIVRRQAVEDALRESERQQRLLLEQACRLQEELRAMSRSGLQAREDDHRRISRDLHDDIAQTLVGINVHLEALARMSGKSPKELRQRITQTQQLVRNSVTAVLQFALALRPASLDDLGLNISLKTLLTEFMQRTGIRVHFKTFAGVDQLNGDQQITLYRIAQTGLSNVAEHSQASRVELHISQKGQVVHLKLTDNGKAFNVQQASCQPAGPHLGLISMRERAEMLGGSFRAESRAGKGTTLHVQIPLTSQDRIQK